MWRLIKFFWTGSLHECRWETVQSGNMVDQEGGTPVGKYFYLRCKDCGKHKRESFHV